MHVCTCTCKMYRLHWHVKKYQVVSFIQNIGLKYVNIYVCKCTLIYDYLIKCIWTLKLQYQYLVVLTGKASPSIYSMVMATSRSQTLTVSHWGRVWVTRVWMVTTISSVSCQITQIYKIPCQNSSYIDDSSSSINIKYEYQNMVYTVDKIIDSKKLSICY